MPLPIRRVTPQRKPLRVPEQHFAPPFNSGGSIPAVTSGARRHNLTGVRPRLFAPAPVNPAPVVTRGSLRVPVRAHPSRPVQAQPYNSGSLIPQVSQGVRRRNLSRPAGRLVAPPGANSIPTATRGVARPAARGRPSRAIQAQPYNSGSLPSSAVYGVRRLPAKVRPSRPIPAQPYNSSGIRPLRVSGVKRGPATRPGTRIVVVPPYGAAIAYGTPVQGPQAIGMRPSQAVPATPSPNRAVRSS